MEINAVMLSQCHNECTIQSKLKVVQKDISVPLYLLNFFLHRQLKVDSGTSQRVSVGLGQGSVVTNPSQFNRVKD